jgi:NAD(P)-dependent dehydrogenase (short-subunit alcohol dehydrogenase family)
MYAASKFALEAMTEGMRWELQQFGIKVCILRPGWYLGTNFGASMVTTVDFKNPTGPYQAMLAHMSITRPKVEQGKPDIERVSDKVAELLEMKNPPLRSEVGCLPLRVTHISDAEYEKQLFGFYRLEEFVGSYARSMPGSTEERL